MGLIFGGTKYPLVAPPGDAPSLALACDPFVPVFLDFWQTLINTYCEAAYVAAMAGQTNAVASRACAETYGADPVPYLNSTGFRFPLLALYPESDAAAAELSPLSWGETTTIYKAVYVLPPLTSDQAPRVLPLLPAVRRLLVEGTELFGDPAYQSGANPLAAAGIEQIRFTGAQYGFFSDQNESVRMPCLTMSVLVINRDTPDTSLQVLDRITTTTNDEQSSGTQPFSIITYSDVEKANQ